MAQPIGLTFVDWLIIAVYFGFVLGIGFYLRRYTKTEDDFFLAGRKNTSWVAGLAFLSANLGAIPAICDYALQDGQRYGREFLAGLVGLAYLLYRDDYRQLLYQEKAGSGPRRFGQRPDAKNRRPGGSSSPYAGVLGRYFARYFHHFKRLFLVGERGWDD
jgi:hypothetical protein